MFHCLLDAKRARCRSRIVWYGARAGSYGDQEEIAGSNPCSEAKILTRFFLLISHVEHVGFGSLFFALHKGSDDFIIVHKFETEEGR